SGNAGNSWTQVLAPGGTTDLYGNFVTDVAIVRKTHRKTVVAAIGWRGSPGGGADPNNGLYQSTDGGLTFSLVTAVGFAPQPNIGRVSLAVGPGSQPNLMYAVVQ